MKHLLSLGLFLGVLLSAVPAHGQNLLPSLTAPTRNNSLPLTLTRGAQETEARRAWARSLAPFAASQALDAVSSYGMRELNPMLAGPDGRFGAKAITIKIGFTAAAIGAEYLVVRRWPRAGRVLSRINWGGAAVTSSIAAHNFSLR